MYQGCFADDFSLLSNTLTKSQNERRVIKGDENVANFRDLVDIEKVHSDAL